MAEISAKAVMDLRNKLGIAMMDCKKALIEANGDEEMAIEILRKKGIAKAAAKADRETAEGTVVIEGKAYVKLLCETDFVARNENFVALAHEIAKVANEKGVEAAQAFFDEVKAEKMTQMGENLVLAEVGTIDAEVVGGYVHSNKKVGTIIGLNGGGDAALLADLGMHATAMKPVVISGAEISDDLVAQEKNIWQAQLEAEGKPANIIDGIMKGKEAKFRSEGAFLDQDFVKDASMKVKDLLAKAGATMKKFVRIEI